MITPGEVLARVKQAAQTSPGFVFSRHAMDRANERGITRKDVLNAFLTATHASQEDQGRWRVVGRDEDGDDLKVIISLGVGDRIEVITVA